MEEIFKIKPLTISQIIISLDRLTRFKHTEDKYLRVFKDILTSNLISPKFKKTQLDLMDYEELTKIAEIIFNTSLKFVNPQLSNDFVINEKLLEYENSIFKLDKNTQKLLKNKIDYKSALTLLNCDNLPLNLIWLRFLSEDDNQIENRMNFGLKFPIEKVVIVEGITEEILLPKFAKICGYDFDKLGITLISAGGKNQVVRLFYKFADNLKLSIFILLDNDAKDNCEEITPKLRRQDNIHIIANGEFEDILPLNLIKRTLNGYFKNYSSVILNDLRKDLSMTQILTELFKQRGFDFKKAEFASLVSENISTAKDISSEIKSIIFELI